MRFKFCRTILLLVSFAIMFNGCSSRRSFLDSKEAHELSRPASPDARVIEHTVSRAKLAKVFDAQSSGERIRLVEIFTKTEAEAQLPEYRLFNIVPGGVYDLLGLQTGDVLLSAEEFAIRDPWRFETYIGRLRNEQQAKLEIRREGLPVVLKYTLTD